MSSFPSPLSRAAHLLRSPNSSNQRRPVTDRDIGNASVETLIGVESSSSYNSSNSSTSALTSSEKLVTDSDTASQPLHVREELSSEYNKLIKEGRVGVEVAGNSGTETDAAPPLATPEPGSNENDQNYPKEKHDSNNNSSIPAITPPASSSSSSNNNSSNGSIEDGKLTDTFTFSGDSLVNTRQLDSTLTSNNNKAQVVETKQDESPEDPVITDLLNGAVEKSKICALISGNDEKSVARRHCFLAKFEFSAPLLSALRHFLSSFVLAGETQQQDRILYAFSERYFQCTRQFNLVTIYQIVYSCILLNTDLTLAGNLGRRMTVEQYIENTLHAISSSSSVEINDASNKEKVEKELEELLRSIYEDIRLTPILQTVSTEPNGKNPSSATSPNSTIGSVTLQKRPSIFRTLSLRSGDSVTSKTSVHRNPSFPSTISEDASVSKKPEAPYKHGVLIKKQVMDGMGRKSTDRKWAEYFCVILGSDLHLYSMPSSQEMMTFQQAANNEESLEKLINALKLQLHIPLRHALASQLPSKAYSESRPYVFQIMTPNGGLSLFQCESFYAMYEWVSCINYWAALESREPLTTGIGLWYGIEREWLLDFVYGGREEEEARERELERKTNGQHSQHNDIPALQIDDELHRPKDFAHISPGSLAVYSVPLVPYIPTSLSALYEEVSITGPSTAAANPVSKHYHPLKPLGFIARKLAKREEKYQMWKKRLELTCLELERLVFVRELLRCFGIGRGVIDSTALDPSLIVMNSTSGAAVSSLSTVSENGALVLSGSVMSQPDLVSQGGLGSGLLRPQSSVSSMASSETLRNSRASLASVGNNGSGLWKAQSAPLFASIPYGSLIVIAHQKLKIADTSVTSKMFSTLSLDMTPKNGSLADLGVEEGGAESDSEPHSVVTLPPPLNLIVTVPQLPKCVLDLLLCAPDAKQEYPLPNFDQLNKKMALRIDSNWNSKFRFLINEAVKSYHYMRALGDGVVLGVPNTATPSIGQADQSSASIAAQIEPPGSVTITPSQSSTLKPKKTSSFSPFKFRRNQSKLRNEVDEHEQSTVVEEQPQQQQQLFAAPPLSRQLSISSALSPFNARKYAENLIVEKELEVSRKFFAEYRCLERCKGIDSLTCQTDKEKAISNGNNKH